MYNYIYYDIQIKLIFFCLFQRMETLRQGAELVFLYQLVHGVCDSSYACHIASQAGLSENIIKRGSQVSSHMEGNKHMLILVDVVHCKELPILMILGVWVHPKK